MYLIYQKARHNSEAAREAQATHYNKHSTPREFQIGDLVYITNEARKAKRKVGTDKHGNEDSRKFRMAWLGVHKVMAKKGESVY